MHLSTPWRALGRRSCLALLAGAALGFSAGALAQAPSAVHVTGAWIRWLPAGLPAGGYMVLHNDSNRPVALVAASSPDYGQTMLHHSEMRDGTMHMLPVARVEVPAHGELQFKPGGYHIMLMQARHEVHPGDQVPVLLRFADGRQMRVPFEVRKPGASGDGQGPGDAQQHGGMQGMPMPQPGH